MSVQNGFPFWKLLGMLPLLVVCHHLKVNTLCLHTTPMFKHEGRQTLVFFFFFFFFFFLFS